MSASERVGRVLAGAFMVAVFGGAIYGGFVALTDSDPLGLGWSDAPSESDRPAPEDADPGTIEPPPGTIEPPPAEAKKRCGSFERGSERVFVGVHRGGVPCRSARRTIRRFFMGRGTQHGDGSTAGTYYVVGRWRCFSHTDGGTCIRGGRRYETARHVIKGRIA